MDYARFFKSTPTNHDGILIFLIAVLLISTTDTFAQDDFDETKMVGFACFFEGRPTKVVTRVEKLLKKNRYTSIREMLNSTNNAERFMAVVCLEGLSTAGRLTLTTEEGEQIARIKSSPELVAVCSGCFPQPGVPLKDAFHLGILWGADLWVKKHIKN